MDDQQEALDAAGLRATFGGEVVTPDDPSYDDARAVWNDMVTARPASSPDARPSPTSPQR